MLTVDAADLSMNTSTQSHVKLHITSALQCNYLPGMCAYCDMRIVMDSNPCNQVHGLRGEGLVWLIGAQYACWQVTAGQQSVTRATGAATCAAVLQPLPISHHFHGCTALLVLRFVVIKWCYIKYLALLYFLRDNLRLAGVCAYAQQLWCAARFTTSLRTYAVNTYAADVPCVDVGPQIDLCAKSQPSGKHEATECADFHKLDSDPVGVAGVVTKIKAHVAYNLVLLTWIPVMCMICACHAHFGSDSRTK